MKHRALAVLACVALLTPGTAASTNAPKRAIDEAKAFELPAGVPGAAEPERTRQSRHSDAVSFADAFAALRAEVGPGNALVLFEGVPRFGDKAFLDAERERRKTVTIDGELFFADAVNVPPEVAEQLRVTVFGAARVAKGVKLCGGFHADFLLRWKRAAGETMALLCFGCGEVKIQGPGGSLYGDLAKEESKTLRELLAPFGKKRPPIVPTKVMR